MRLFCVLYFLMVEKAESSFGASLGGCSIYRRRFYLARRSSLAPPRCPILLFSLFSFPICVPVRLVRRLVGRLVMRLVLCVPLGVSFVVSSCQFVSPVGSPVISFGTVSLCCSLVLVSHGRGGLALRSRASRSALAFCLVRRLARRLVLLISFLSCHLVLANPWAARVRFHVRSSVRAVPSCSSLVLVRSSVSVSLSPSWGGAMRHWAEGFAILISSVSSRSYSLLARCG